MTTKTLTEILLLTLVTGCVGPYNVVDSDDTTDETGTSSDGYVLDMPADDGCSVDDAYWKVDDQARTWVRVEGWSAWAQWADPNDITAGVDAGTLTPVGDDCYDIDGFDVLTCVVTVCGVDLLGHPVDGLAASPATCASDGPWSQVVSLDGYIWSCWGVVDDVAVRLSPLTDCEYRPGSISCACTQDDECVEGLACRDGGCGPCPAGQLGCACEVNNACDSGTCTNGLCL